MSRENSEARTCFKSMCRTRNLNENIVLKRTKMLLSTYRRICWQTSDRYSDLENDEGQFCYIHPDLTDAIDYLECFDPDREKNQFEDKIRTLFETRWMLELVDQTMLRVREFPGYGQTYFTILNDCYLSSMKFKESDMLLLLKVERSRYYDWKKDAIIAFAMALWNDALPRLKSFLTNPEYDETDYEPEVPENRKVI